MLAIFSVTSQTHRASDPLRLIARRQIVVALLLLVAAGPASAQNPPAVKHWRVTPPGTATESVRRSGGGYFGEPAATIAPVEYVDDLDYPDDLEVAEAPSRRARMDGWRHPPSDACDDWLDEAYANSLCGFGLLRIDRPTGYWLSGGYLRWSITGANLPPLLRSGDGTSLDNIGVLGQPGQTLLGGTEANMTSSGFEIGGGVWFDNCQHSGWEFRYSGLPQQFDRQTVDSVWTLGLGRPYVAGDGNEAALLVAHPNFADGMMTQSTWTELHSVEALRRDALRIVGPRRVDSLIGFRYLYLGEGLQLDQRTEYFAPQAPIAAGTLIEISDQFRTRNHFTSFSLGLDATERFSLFDFNLRGGLSLGVNSMEVEIAGETTATVPNSSGVPVAATFPGGLLAQSTNGGRQTLNRFALLPELQTGITAHLTSNWRWEVGYRLFYLSEAVQPGDQIDRSASQLPPETPIAPFTPAPTFRTGGVLVQGLRTAMVFDF
ncbi:MAG: hypothetical protein EA381_13450 [Planctomycetaceae bacterium]|nr:MAG: hypothetical protein EA381_13450 [Planctomycetaceae bacterium]